VEEGFIGFGAEGYIDLLDPSGVVAFFEQKEKSGFRFFPDRAGITTAEGVSCPGGEGQQKEGTAID
jgi:hypothetical protein